MGLMNVCAPLSVTMRFTIRTHRHRQKFVVPFYSTIFHLYVADITETADGRIDIVLAAEKDFAFLGKSH